MIQSVSELRTGLATMPCSTGSALIANTIGIVTVALFAARGYVPTGRENQGNVASDKLGTGIAGCCARAASGHATVVPPSADMNCRLPMPIAI